MVSPSFSAQLDREVCGARLNLDLRGAQRPAARPSLIISPRASPILYTEPVSCFGRVIRRALSIRRRRDYAILIDFNSVAVLE